MVKKRVGGAHRYKAVQKAAGDGGNARKQQESGPKPPSHLQRKITKSVKFYEKVLTSGTPKAPQGVSKKKKKPAKTLASLDSLAAELDHITTAGGGGSTNAASSSSSASQQPAALLAKGKGRKSSIKRSKARLAVNITESTRLQKVLQHPAYKSNPVQAVLNHLMNTMPAAPQQQQQQRGAGGASGQQKKCKKKHRQQQQQGGGGVGGADEMQD